MAKMLTDLIIRNLKPRAVRYEVGDAGARCLRVIVQPSGAKSYVVRFTNAAGQRRKLTLPGGITLAAARKLAADALLEVAQDRDPALARKGARQVARERAGDTVERLAGQFLEQHAKRKTRENSWRATEGIFRREIIPAWGGRSVHQIVRRNIIDLLDEIAGDRPIMANRAKAALSRFFGWLAARDVITTSPCVGIPSPSAETARERALDDAELRRLWLACEALGGRERACIRLLILTGQRRSEIAKLRWSEVGADVLELPALRMKGKRPHVVPLSAQAAAIIAAMPELVSQVPNGYVFGVDHFDRIKQVLDQHMGNTPKWVTHDIRRSVATGMARIGVAVPVIEKILAHRSGTFAGITEVYQRHSFVPEMAAALQRWADHIDRLVGNKPAKLVKLHRQ
jgi:integrase